MKQDLWIFLLPIVLNGIDEQEVKCLAILYLPADINKPDLLQAEDIDKLDVPEDINELKLIILKLQKELAIARNRLINPDPRSEISRNIMRVSVRENKGVFGYTAELVKYTDSIVRVSLTTKSNLDVKAINSVSNIAQLIDTVYAFINIDENFKEYFISTVPPRPGLIKFFFGSSIEGGSGGHMNALSILCQIFGFKINPDVGVITGT